MNETTQIATLPQLWLASVPVSTRWPVLPLENILIPDGPQERYHQLVEEAYAVLGLIETQVDALRSELEYQHKRLDEARDAAFAEAIRREE